MLSWAVSKSKTSPMRYVALLRGVNVGGKNRVPKAEFQEVLEDLGFTDVVIYINSGNAVFTSDHIVSADTVRGALETHFGFPIPTLVLSGDKIKKITATIPSHWTNDAPNPDKTGQKSDVLYLFDDANEPNVLQKIGYNPEIETMIYTDGAVLVNVLRKNQMRSSLQKITVHPVFKLMTIRNIATAKKLAELVDK